MIPVRTYPSTQWEMRLSLAIPWGASLVPHLRMLVNSTHSSPKYDAFGNTLWTRQFGTPSDEGAYGVVTDQTGNIYVAGLTQGDLNGTDDNSVDAYIRKYNPNGGELWTRQFDDEFLGIAAFDITIGSNGALFVVGTEDATSSGVSSPTGPDAFLKKYDSSSGTLNWTREIDSGHNDSGLGVAVDGLGGIYVTGNTQGDLAGVNSGITDAFVRRFDANGNLRWTRQLGTSQIDGSNAIAADDQGNAYIAGYSHGNIGNKPHGNRDAFVAKYDMFGNQLWIKQFGAFDPNSRDEATGIALDVEGNVIVSGTTDEQIGDVHIGGDDGFATKIDPDGNLIWSKQFGTSGIDRTDGIAIDASGGIYLTGSTRRAFDGSINAGGEDMFLVNIQVRDPDFNNDGLIDCLDVDNLVAEIAAGSDGADFDLTGDGVVDAEDLDEWLAQAGAANLPSGNSYLVGDANLDGTVDGSDFFAWNNNKFTDVAGWCSADFNADDIIDGEDFLLWNGNKFLSSDNGIAIPEPIMSVLWMATFIGFALRR